MSPASHFGGDPYHAVSEKVSDARDRAWEILKELEARTRVSPQLPATARLFQALGRLAIDMHSTNPQPPPLTTVVRELERQLPQCIGDLTIMKPHLEEALRLAGVRS